jgi:hypothetical protein
MHTAGCRKAQGRAITRVSGDSLFEKRQGLPCLPVVGGGEHRIGTQIGVIGAEIACRLVRRPRALGRLQRRLDDSGDADRDLLLQFEHIFERSVEAVGP